MMLSTRHFGPGSQVHQQLMWNWDIVARRELSYMQKRPTPPPSCLGIVTSPAEPKLQVMLRQRVNIRRFPLPA
jgi:hypothetical protein